MKSSYLEQIEHEIVVLLRRADFKKTLDGEKISLDRSAYLLLKKLRNEGSLAIADIAQSFQLDLSTVSRQVAALEKKGFVRRFSDAKDARVSIMEITEAGAQNLETVLKQRLLSYSEGLADWTEDEIQVFAKLLSRLNRTMEQRRRLEQ